MTSSATPFAEILGIFGQGHSTVRKLATDIGYDALQTLRSIPAEPDKPASVPPIDTADIHASLIRFHAALHDKRNQNPSFTAVTAHRPFSDEAWNAFRNLSINTDIREGVDVMGEVIRSHRCISNRKPLPDSILRELAIVSAISKHFDGFDPDHGVKTALAQNGVKIHRLEAVLNDPDGYREVMGWLNRQYGIITAQP
ncbi:MAG: hypothetical protein KGI97_00655 [Alphaproteobacteria bacterium]|nr:hypothetical protein [Alphaproteobacteria bacterium]